MANSAWVETNSFGAMGNFLLLCNGKGEIEKYVDYREALDALKKEVFPLLISLSIKMPNLGDLSGLQLHFAARMRKVSSRKEIGSALRSIKKDCKRAVAIYRAAEELKDKFPLRIIEIEDVSGVVDTLVDLGESSEGSVVAPSFVEFSKYLEESKVSIEGNLTKSLQHLQSGELESASQYLGQAEERAEICGKLYRDLQA